MAGVISIFHFILLFALYSFLGWIIEVIYRSITQRHFVNAGFVFGPFLPIYGFGAAAAIFLESFLSGWHLIPRFIILGLVITAIEYLVGFFAERIFKLTLWDYSENKFNLHGRICLHFSILWTILALLFVMFIHPAAIKMVTLLDDASVKTTAVLFLVYFAVDYFFSVLSISAFRKRIAYLYTEYLNLDNIEIENILNSLQRLRDAFPALNRYVDTNINSNIRNRISTFLKPIQDKIIMEMQGRMSFEPEYYEIIQDIEQHEEFLKLKEYFHHNSSIYAHVQEVAYLSYRICKFLKLDYRSAARGALLHDFFLYDWRNHDVPDLPRHKFHGIEHPSIALENARKHFAVNEIEADIIRKHMWPLTLVPPQYKESFIVSFADKYLSSKEFISEYGKKRHRRRKQRASNRQKNRRVH
ncbi:MAG: hypothetical protein CVU54_15625 [Deltaproteobacteria bacterium HGW-Deltaproteobacteria-12]|nr:MAG: hypothetical protein CVU54_15625 [Deltaproteobacteria bacterium HGW-Deltaproteobacteria-12]